MNDNVFKELESNVRSYCRNFPEIFETGKGSYLYDNQKQGYLDFFSGAGSLNYGHNDPDMSTAMQKYISDNGILQSLDLYTTTKEQFLKNFKDYILLPRKLNYKVQFAGPTGTNAVEAAIKLARKVTQRHSIACFTESYHGMSLGALSITANPTKRDLMGVQVPGVTRLPYDQFLDLTTAQQLDLIERMFTKLGSGVELPAAIILECIQGEGGVNVASAEWLQGISKIAKKIGSLLIIDDIQAGCGRSGDFFSFEFAEILPDIICLSKSISGIGLPLAITLISPEIDLWNPGEHNGTFRGNNLALLCGAISFEKFWSTHSFSEKVKSQESLLKNFFNEHLKQHQEKFSISGRGLFIGLNFEDPTLAKKIADNLFKKKLVIETCGPQNNVLKCMPALTITDEELIQGAKMIVSCINECIN